MAVDTMISGIGAAQYAQQQLGGHLKAVPTANATDGDTNAQEHVISQAGQVGDQVQLNHSASATKNLNTARSIEEMQAKLNQLAKNVRRTNEGLMKVADKSDQMSNTLDTILKNFPPFPPDSQQRKEKLMSIVSIRKEIEKLTVPPPPPPVYEKVKHMWDSLFSGNGQMLSSAVPAVTSSSSDQELKDASKSLDNSAAKLTLLSKGIVDALTGG